MNKLKTKLYLLVKNRISSLRQLQRKELSRERLISSVVSLRAVKTLTKQSRSLQLSRHTKSEVKTNETRKENCRIVYASISRR